MSKIKNGGLDQYSAEPFERQQFGTADVEGVNPGAYYADVLPYSSVRNLTAFHCSIARSFFYSIPLPHANEVANAFGRTCLSVRLSLCLSVCLSVLLVLQLLKAFIYFIYS